MSEVSRKIEFIRKILINNNFSAIRLRGVDWFSWATGGGTSVVIMTSEVGIAEVFISVDEAWILTNRIESERLSEEEIPPEFKVTSFAWQDTFAADKFVAEKVQNSLVYSDRPIGIECDLPPEIKIYKTIMQPEEISRYRQVGHLAAVAMTEAISRAQPNWTENQLAGAGAEALWSRGLEPTLILVSGHQRGQKFRHPIPKDAVLGESAMMVFCARSSGLYANLTRFVFFRELSTVEKQNFAKLMLIENAAFKMTKANNDLSSVYSALKFAYRAAGIEHEIDLHHQGGPCGYLSREYVATPDLKVRIEAGMAFAWNPSLPGAKMEDTALLTDSGLEILTADPDWPVIEVGGIKRPNVWVRNE